MLRNLIAAAALLCSACLWAGESPKHALAFDRAETQAPDSIGIVSPAFAEGGTIPLRFSAYGEGISPPLSWTGIPDDAVSLVLMMEDPDAVSVRPYLHWVVWNIAADAGGLPQGVEPGSQAGVLATIVQGRNTRRKAGYFGPRPSGSKPHRYFFQLFALDTRLSLDPDAKRSEIIAALKGHVMAKGKLTGLFKKPG
jgi:Raf kinase inhibitor-like YbhB/YbcL family protein